MFSTSTLAQEAVTNTAVQRTKWDTTDTTTEELNGNLLDMQADFLRQQRIRFFDQDVQKKKCTKCTMFIHYMFYVWIPLCWKQ